MKRFVSMLLTLCLLCSMAVPGAFAQDVSIPTADSAEAPLGAEAQQPAEEAPLDVAPLDPAADAGGGEAPLQDVETDLQNAFLDEGEVNGEEEAPDEEPVAVEVLRGSGASAASAGLEEAPVTPEEGAEIQETVEFSGELDLMRRASQYNELTTDNFTSFGDQLSGFTVSVNGVSYSNAGYFMKKSYDALATDFAKGDDSRIFQQKGVACIALYQKDMSDSEMKALMLAIAKAAGFSFDWDTPELFYSNSSLGYSVVKRASDGAWVLTLMPKANREFADQGFRSTVKGILEQRIATLTAATKGMTDEQAVRYYHDWLCENNAYNNAAYQFVPPANPTEDEKYYRSMLPWSAASALMGNSGVYNEGPVCEGYARALQWLCKATGIQCILVVSADHMWNNLVVNNKWTGVDVTFDDGAGGSYNHDYFLKDSLNGSASHHIEKMDVGNGGTIEFAYPALGKVDQVAAFVTRLYEKLLGRSPDLSGKGTWVTELKSGRMGGADVASGFVTGVELKNRNLDDETYVGLLYETFMDRTADAGGMQSWLDWMSQGISRNLVFRGFVESGEYEKICASYGIDRGTLNLPNYADRNLNLTLFVIRLYTKALDRQAEEQGIEDWCRGLLTGQFQGASAAAAFIFGSEFTNKNYCNEHYLEHLYTTFMDRAPDAGGLAMWMGELEKGMTREEVFNGFALSPEFSRICSSAGIASGFAIDVPEKGKGTVQNGPCSICGKQDSVPQPDVPEQPVGPEQPNVPDQPNVPEQPSVPDQPSVVYLASGSSKVYHRSPNCSNMRAPVAVSLADAQAAGCRPCKVCFH